GPGPSTLEQVDDFTLCNFVLWPFSQLFVFEHRFADDFVDVGDAGVDGAEAALAQGDHAHASAGRPQLVGRGAGGNQVAEFIIHHDQLVDAAPAFVAGVVAAVAAAAVDE